ncbi:hypothetical protein LIER_36095 [Lithospermum erythrorhizon]|uniref:Uncharacterized protein n=1 Tax=Lithospermum erythrorhizon TaxID=34254 RepID=A0AAV3P4T7_LITER
MKTAFVGCEAIEICKDKGGKKLFRIKAKVNVNQPIRRMIKALLEKSWVEFRLHDGVEVHGRPALKWEAKGDSHAQMVGGEEHGVNRKGNANGGHTRSGDESLKLLDDADKSESTAKVANRPSRSP